MATLILTGRKVLEIELLDVFPPDEGDIAQYYGRIGQGKTYAATADILDLLRRGHVVYSNWRINWNGFDERASTPHILLSLLFPWRRRFYNLKRENLRYLPVDENFHERFALLTDCYVFLDEGHVAFDSYEMARLSLARRASILHTRHFNRSIRIISQRPTAIHVAMRANVNRFYKCEKRWEFWRLVRFRRTEFQDMLNETVDDDEEKAVSIKQYWGSRQVFDAYPSKYLRGETVASQSVEFEAYDFGYIARFALLIRALLGRKEKLSTVYPQVKHLTMSPPYPVQLGNEPQPTDIRGFPVSIFREAQGAPSTPTKQEAGKMGKKNSKKVLRRKLKGAPSTPTKQEAGKMGKKNSKKILRRKLKVGGVVMTAVMVFSASVLTAEAGSFAKNVAESKVSDVAFKGGDFKQEISALPFRSADFVSRVDVYEAPCGKGFQVFIGDAQEVESVGYGCEAKERTFTLNKGNLL